MLRVSRAAIRRASGHVREGTRFWLHRVLLGNPTEMTDDGRFPDDASERADHGVLLQLLTELAAHAGHE